MEQHRKEAGEHKEKYLPLVYLIVFYNGETVYPYSIDLLALFDHPRELVEQILFQPFQLIDLNTIADEKLKADAWTSIMYIVMKHIYARDVTPHIEDWPMPGEKLTKRVGKIILRPHLIIFLQPP